MRGVPSFLTHGVAGCFASFVPPVLAACIDPATRYRRLLIALAVPGAVAYLTVVVLAMSTTLGHWTAAGLLLVINFGLATLAGALRRLEPPAPRPPGEGWGLPATLLSGLLGLQAGYVANLLFMLTEPWLSTVLPVAFYEDDWVDYRSLFLLLGAGAGFALGRLRSIRVSRLPSLTAAFVLLSGFLYLGELAWTLLVNLPRFQARKISGGVDDVEWLVLLEALLIMPLAYGTTRLVWQPSGGRRRYRAGVAGLATLLLPLNVAIMVGVHGYLLIFAGTVLERGVHLDAARSMYARSLRIQEGSPPTPTSSSDWGCSTTRPAGPTGPRTLSSGC